MVPGGALTEHRESSAHPRTAGGAPTGPGGVVLLAGSGPSTDVVANYLSDRVPDLVLVVEEPQSRLELARRRARRIGWVPAVGQVLFVAIQPVLRRLGAHRRAAIFREASLDTSHRVPTHRVSSVNDDATLALLTSLRPTMVVVHGTRIIAARILGSVDCPVVNMHAGITLRYRGVHGGYWALAERHPEWVGTTVHLVDPGIDTGGILAQATFVVSPEDTIATYPDLHLVHGLPLLGAQVDKVIAGSALEPVPASIATGSGFYYHPTLWSYLWRRWRDGVR
jgi:folate-dependent phosphoribosylglycinamide formyltransferase PurN